MYKIELENEYKNMKYVVLFTKMGHRCGYVGVDKNNPLYGFSYGDKISCLKKKNIEDKEIGKRGIISLVCADMSTEEICPELYFDVHGGITYSGGGGGGSTYPIKSDLWWFGFDCAHCDDGKDMDLAYEYELIDLDYKNRIQEIENMYPTYETVRTLDYVEQECKNLIDQILELEGEN